MTQKTPKTEEVKEALLALRALSKSNPLVTFRPYSEEQMSVMQADKRRIAIFGNNRSGKSTIGAVRLCMHATGYYPEWFPEHARFRPPVKCRILCSEYREHGKVIEGKLTDWLPPNTVKKWHKNAQGYLVGVSLRNGSFISVLSHEQSTRQHEGWDGHVIWADEPCPQDKFIANIRGLVDHNGEFYITLSPLSEPWLADEVFDDNPDKWQTIMLDSRANPHISQQALEDFWDSVPEHELPARKEGKFIHLAGVVYPNFDMNRHIVDERNFPEDWPRICVVDPHDRRPFAMAWAAIDPTDRLWFYDEYPNDRMFHKILSTNLKIDDFATIIRNKEGRLPSARRIIDARYGARRSVLNGSTIQEQLATFGLYFEPSYGENQGDIETGHILVKEYLGKPDQEPRIFFTRNCKNLIYAMTHYVYDEKTGKPKEHGKDFADLVRYGCADRPRYDAWAGINSPTLSKPDSNTGVTGYGQ